MFQIPPNGENCEFTGTCSRSRKGTLARGQRTSRGTSVGNSAIDVLLKKKRKDTYTKKQILMIETRGDKKRDVLCNREIRKQA